MLQISAGIWDNNTVIHSAYRRDPSVVARRIGQETILVPVRRNLADLESIYTLNSVAAALWERLETEQTSERLAAFLVEIYEVAFDQAQQDVACFLDEMESLSLVEVADHAR